MKLDQAGTYTYALYAQRNFNEDMLQSKFCPFCRQFDIDAEDFYYKTDSNGEFERYYTDEEVIRIQKLIQAEKDRKELENKKAAEAWTQLILWLVSISLYAQCGLGIVQAAMFRKQLTKKGVKINLIVSAIVSALFWILLVVSVDTSFENAMQQILFNIMWIYTVFEMIIHIVFVNTQKLEANNSVTQSKKINLSKEDETKILSGEQYES